MPISGERALTDSRLVDLRGHARHDRPMTCAVSHFVFATYAGSGKDRGACLVVQPHKVPDEMAIVWPPTSKIRGADALAHILEAKFDLDQPSLRLWTTQPHW